MQLGVLGSHGVFKAMRLDAITTTESGERKEEA